MGVTHCENHRLVAKPVRGSACGIAGVPLMVAPHGTGAGGVSVEVGTVPKWSALTFQSFWWVARS